MAKSKGEQMMMRGKDMMAKGREMMAKGKMMMKGMPPKGMMDKKAKTKKKK